MEQVILILLLLVFLNTYDVEAAPTYLYSTCNSVNYTSNSTYKKNLKTTLSALSASNNTNAIGTGFANATTGQATSDTVYGLYLCRGDVNPAVCDDCVKRAYQEIIQRCPSKRASIIWYDECLLRYSNSYIFGSAESNGDTMYNTNAANSETGKKFAVGKANFTSFRTLYTLTQCTPDIAASDCNSCLQQISAQLPLDKQGSRYWAPSCSVRVELYPFYNESAVLVPPPSPVPVQPPSRTAPPPFPVTNKGKKISTAVIVAIVAPVAAGVVLILIGCCFIRRKSVTEEIIKPDESGMKDMSSAGSLQFDLATIQATTNNFSPTNKLGEGGFGLVYKGTLPNGKKIAVKRLSRNPGQGAVEFRNEVKVVAKLQHRNLVQLFGFCLEGEEKLLVFEFMPTRALTTFYLFYIDPEKQVLLDWKRRHKIMTGIAKGMLYLHEDSRLRIIHRDLKPSNVLLDSEFNPKVSDFGMARIFGVDQTQGNTSRVVGTYGYMSPEYAMDGQISVKTDVYSFGILLLEIISGKKSNFLHQSGHTEILPSFAWKHWRNGTPLEIVDPLLGDSFNSNEAIRCIQIALLCVQENPANRPTMATIVLMLSSQSVSMAVPQQPAFFFHSMTGNMEMIYSKASSSGQSTSKSASLSVNDVSITELYPR